MGGGKGGGFEMCIMENSSDNSAFESGLKIETMVTSHRYKFDLFYLEQNLSELMILG